MRRRLLAFAALPVLALAVPAETQAGEWVRLAQQQAAPAAEATPPATPGQAKMYSNGKIGFSMPVPPGAEVVERKGTNQVSVRSRKGYVINLQAGPKRPEIPLARMSSLLEPKYLGAGKPWSTRGRERAMQVGGLSAHEVNYAGAASKARVVIARGTVHDYVFIFIAPENEFRRLETEFDWALRHFQPAETDLRVAARPASPAAQQSAQQSARQSAQRFAEPGYGYVIEYPAAWEMSKPAAMAAMFSGREGTPEYAAIVGIQNIAPPGAKSPDEAAQRAFNQLKSSLGNAVRELRIIDDQRWTYVRGTTRLVGRQLVVTYRHAGEIFKKRMIVVPRPDGGVAHVWSYTAPDRQYAGLRPLADKMLRSWTINTGAAH